MKNINNNSISYQLPQNQKKNIPPQHFRYKGVDYPLNDIGLSNEYFYCKYCNSNHVKIIGYFIADNLTYYVLFCSIHPFATEVLEEKKLILRYPWFSPVQISQYTQDGFPAQLVRCSFCKGTTAQIIRESSDKLHWIVQCRGCKDVWTITKDKFEDLYIGSNGNLPKYAQCKPRRNKRQ